MQTKFKIDIGRVIQIIHGQCTDAMVQKIKFCNFTIILMIPKIYQNEHFAVMFILTARKKFSIKQGNKENTSISCRISETLFVGCVQIMRELASYLEG